MVLTNFGMEGTYFYYLNKSSMICLFQMKIFYTLIFLHLCRYEKLQRWDDALKAYTVKASQVSSPHLVLEATLGWLEFTHVGCHYRLAYFLLCSYSHSIIIACFFISEIWSWALFCNLPKMKRKLIKSYE